MKLQLPDVTLLSYASIRIPEHIESIKFSCENIKFGSVVFVSHEEPNNLPNCITEFMWHKKIENIMDYNYMTFFDLGQFVRTSHVLLIQDHAFPIHPELWDNDWLNIDYLGSPWPIKENSYMADNGERIRVGNGGFSLRSNKLINAAKKLQLSLKQEQGYYNEDGNTCCYHRTALLKYGIKYGTLEQAVRFSFETPLEENNWGKMKTFGFHRNLPFSYYKDFGNE